MKKDDKIYFHKKSFHIPTVIKILFNLCFSHANRMLNKLNFITYFRLWEDLIKIKGTFLNFSELINRIFEAPNVFNFQNRNVYANGQQRTAKIDS